MKISTQKVYTLTLSQDEIEILSYVLATSHIPDAIKRFDEKYDAQTVNKIICEMYNTVYEEQCTSTS